MARAERFPLSHGGRIMSFLRLMTLLVVGAALVTSPARGEEPAAAEPSAEQPAQEPAAPAEDPAATPAEPSSEAPAEAAATEEAAPAEAAHQVTKGDTLWDLASRYYKDPYKWNRIWEANRDAIRNPNLIYPDQKLSLPDGAVEAPAAEAPAEETPAAETPAAEAPAAETPAAEAPSEETPAAEAPAAETPAAEAPAAEAPAVETPVEEAVASPSEEAAEEAPEEVKAPAGPVQPAFKKEPGFRYIPTTLGDDNFIVDENWEADGYILYDEIRKLMISQDDVVYINVGVTDGAKPRMRGGVYRRGGVIRDPDSNDKLGYVMRRIGTFQLTENVGEASSSAVITSSKEPIRKGDIVRLENN
jgi:LysM repeat protein